jgi:hypothetical protein
VPIKAPVVRSVSAANVRPIVRIVFIRRDLRTLPKRKADKSHKDDQGEKRSYPIWHGLLQRGTSIIPLIPRQRIQAPDLRERRGSTIVVPPAAANGVMPAFVAR